MNTHGQDGSSDSSEPPPAKPGRRRPSAEAVWVGAAILTFIALAAMLAGPLWRWRPTYTAQALLEVHPLPQRIDPAAISYVKEAFERRKRHLADLAKQREVLAAAAKDPRITSTRWYQKHKDNTTQALTEAVEVSPVPETRLLRFSMTGRNTEKLPDIVNAVVDAFLSRAVGAYAPALEKDIKRLQDQGKFLERRLNEVRQQLTEAPDEGESAQRVEAVREHAAALEDTLQKLETRLLELRSKRGPITVAAYAAEPQ